MHELKHSRNSNPGALYVIAESTDEGTRGHNCRYLRNNQRHESYATGCSGCTLYALEVEGHVVDELKYELAVSHSECNDLLYRQSCQARLCKSTPSSQIAALVYAEEW